MRCVGCNRCCWAFRDIDHVYGGFGSVSWLPQLPVMHQCSRCVGVDRWREERGVSVWVYVSTAVGVGVCSTNAYCKSSYSPPSVFPHCKFEKWTKSTGNRSGTKECQDNPTTKIQFFFIQLWFLLYFVMVMLSTSMGSNVSIEYHINSDIGTVVRIWLVWWCF